MSVCRGCGGIIRTDGFWGGMHICMTDVEQVNHSAQIRVRIRESAKLLAEAK